ncbi:MAG: alpha/beta fold hydrolase [Candidatus Adiutrix sp.]|nr:alpha/beta fold hydrolase [Candidatus Adiutrix sp.]
MINPEDPSTLPNPEGYPFRRKYHALPGGLRLNHVDEGAGPPVLMVHGNPTWSFFYRRLISELAPDFRCLAPDHIGMGLSSRPGADEYGFRLSDRVADLGHFIDGLGLTEPLHLVTHDWGGPIGLAWAADHPDQTASLTILNTATRVPAGYRLPWRLALFKKMEPLGAYLAVRHNLFVRGTAALGVVKPLSEAAKRGFAAPYETAADRLAIGRFVADIPLSPRHPSFAFLAEADRKAAERLRNKPMTLVWGLRDFVFNRAVFFDWRRRFPEAEVLALPEAGHYLLEDEPDRAAGHIRNFISRCRRN